VHWTAGVYKVLSTIFFDFQRLVFACLVFPDHNGLLMGRRLKDSPGKDPQPPRSQPIINTLCILPNPHSISITRLYPLLRWHVHILADFPFRPFWPWPSLYLNHTAIPAFAMACPYSSCFSVSPFLALALTLYRPHGCTLFCDGMYIF